MSLEGFLKKNSRLKSKSVFRDSTLQILKKLQGN